MSLDGPVTREVAVAAALFAAMCVAVLVKAPQLLEPDDYAYRASIVALSEGHVLLTNAQYLALFTQLSAHNGGGILQWVHLANGRWISQKNPGYPFLAVLFQWLHALRWAPLFYGGLACAGLFYGARRWLGPWGGVYAVGLYCFSGVALSFAWRATMSTFTDASLIAGGAGLLLGVLLSTHDRATRRTVLGTLAFVALELAVLVRYSDVAVLIVAIVAVLALYRASSLTRAMLLAWLGSVAVFALGDLVLNRALYGGPLTTGYQSGLITFALSAVALNVQRMPVRLVEAMPVCLLALARSRPRPSRCARRAGAGRGLGQYLGALRHVHLDGPADQRSGQPRTRRALLRARARVARPARGVAADPSGAMGAHRAAGRDRGHRTLVLPDAGQPHHRGAAGRARPRPAVRPPGARQRSVRFDARPRVVAVGTFDRPYRLSRRRAPTALRASLREEGLDRAVE
jgi:hypothetical protein